MPAFPPPLPPGTGDAIVPFRAEAPQALLDDLTARLAHTRWPERETVADWSQGAPLDKVRALVETWRTAYDWRRCEAALNAWPQFRTVVDGLPIHFLHVRSPHSQAMPLVLTHGWPGSVLEFLKVIGPLTDPVAHGGRVEDAFHLVIPSLPGYGFSGKPDAPGWSVERIADAWGVLMARLGYDRFGAQGGDWGSAVTRAMAERKVPGLLGIHLNMVICLPPEDETFEDAEAREGRDVFAAFREWGTGYSAIQSTRPQTLGYGLTDSPVGQAAWIYEKFQAWTQNEGNPESVLSVDEMLDTITLYWLTASATSSARLYWESFRTAFGGQPLDLPVACSIFPGELARPPRRWVERVFSNIVHWNRTARGGHFAAFEQPAIFVDEVRAGFRPMR